MNLWISHFRYRTSIHASRFVLGFFIFIFSSTSLHAQKSRQQLEQEKKDNLSRIAQAEKILVETEKEKTVTIGQLQALQNQIGARGALIRSLKNEIDLLAGEIKEINSVVRALEVDLANLKKEYAAMIYSSYKSNQGYSMLTFLFSSSTFNELFMRLKYLDQYADARKTQAEQIELVTTELLSQRAQVQQRKNQQDILLGQELSENQKLLGLKTKQDNLVKALSTKQSELKAEVENRKKALGKLDKLIAELIAREARNNTAKVSDVADNANFESMKAKIPWPVSNGFISAKFGRQAHPVLENIYVDNNGISIQTNKNESVKSVSAGTVTMVADSPGMQRVVMVRHGQYLTVYARLKEVKVTKGQVLNRNDQIGVLYTDNDGLTQLEFQVWKGSTKLNPEAWLQKK
jgi:septal ring factor EnvC (AmiA/AmiB activator)